MDKETAGVIFIMAICAAVGTVAAVFLVAGISVNQVDWMGILGWVLFLTGVFGVLLEVSYRRNKKRPRRVKTS